MNMMNLGKKLGLAATLAFCVMSSANAGTLALDTFDYDLNIAVNSGSTSATDTINNINIFAGDVQYDLLWSLGGNPTGASAVTYGVSDSRLSFNNASNVSSELSLTYAAFDDTPAGPLDLTGGGSFLSFYYDVLFSDGDFDVDVFVGSDDGDNMSILETSSSDVASLTRFTLDFSSFSAYMGFGAANFAAADFVKIVITADNAVDLEITEFGVIPEPTTLAIFGLGLIGLAFGARRKA